MGITSTRNAQEQSLEYPPKRYDLNSPQNPSRSRDGASGGGEPNPEIVTVTSVEVDRSKELSARLRYKYY
jgi:hypothetical protein